MRERLRDGVAKLQLSKSLYSFDYPFAPSEVVEFYRTYYGLTNRAFATLDAAGQTALLSDLEHLWAQNNCDTDGATGYDADYLEVVALRAKTD